MTNRYFNNTIDLLTATKARATQVESNFTAVDAGFLIVETEMDLKVGSESPTITGTAVLPATTSIGNVSATEIAYLDGVTSAIQTQLNALVAEDATKAPLASPTLTGTPAAPTAAPGTNTTQLATTAFVIAESFSAALPVQTGNAGKYVTTDGTTASWGSLAAYAPLASPTLTGNPSAPTPTAGDNDTSIATTAFVATSFAPLASPTLTGTPAAPTATAGTNTTQLATTAFVTGAVGGYAADAIGTYAFAKCNGQIVAFGGTIAGSNLYPVNITETSAVFNSPVPSLTGTWRCMGHLTAATVATLYLRIS